MFFEKIKIVMEKEVTACTGGGKCPLRFFCEYFRNHEERKTNFYFMAEFDLEKGMCINYKQIK